MSSPTAEQLQTQKAQQIVAAQSASRNALTDNLILSVGLTLAAFHAWYDGNAVRNLAQEIATKVGSTQRLVSAQQVAYQVRLLELAGRLPDWVGVLEQRSLDNLRHGVSPEQVYERLAVQYRWDRSQGKTDEQAAKAVATRAEVMNTTDVALADRATSLDFYRKNRISRFKRVIHPELSTHGTCGLCIAASTRVYTVEHLMPIHDRCKCTTAPVIGKFDPAESLNNLDLGQLYDNAGGSNKAADLKRTRYQVNDHGELGPVLAPHGAPVTPAYLSAA